MKIPDNKDDYALVHPQYVQPSDHQTDVLPALIEGICDVIQSELEDSVQIALSENSIANATDSLLDAWGVLVGQPRSGRTDDAYRIAIRSQISINLSTGTWDELIRIVKSLYGDSTMGVYVADHLLAEGELEAQASIETNNISPVLVHNVIERVRPAARRLHYIYWAGDEGNTFAFADGDVIVDDTARGFGDDTETVGGRFCNALAASDGDGSVTANDFFDSWSSGFSDGFGG